jgi:hypothetical protein
MKQNQDMIDSLVGLICHCYDVEPADILKGRTKDKNVIKCRKMVLYILRYHRNIPYKELAGMFNLTPKNVSIITSAALKQWPLPQKPREAWPRFAGGEYEILPIKKMFAHMLYYTLVAVLGEHKQFHATTGLSRAEYLSDELAWLFSDTYPTLLSFRTVCETLNLCASKMRRAIARNIEEGIPLPQHRANLCVIGDGTQYDRKYNR